MAIKYQRCYSLGQKTNKKKKATEKQKKRQREKKKKTANAYGTHHFRNCKSSPELQFHQLTGRVVALQRSPSG